MNTPQASLQRLISPLSVDAFLQDFWPYRPLYVDGSGRDPKELLGFDVCLGFENLIKTWPANALVLPRHGGDEALGKVATVASALNSYRSGSPVFFARPEEVFEELGDWIEQLRIDLGVPVGSRFVSAFHASPGGTSTALHFDHSASIVVQLEGKRIWRLWPNSSHENPTNRYSVVMDRWPDELVDYGRNAVMPAGDGLEITLRPGDCLVVPNGWWHTVDAPAESMALMFIAITYPWADVVLDELRRRLLCDPRWREMAIGARQDSPGYRETARQQLAGLLNELPSIATCMSVDDVLVPRYMRSVGATGVLSGDKLELETSAADAILRLGPAEVSIFRWIALRAGSFTERDMIESGYEREAVRSMLPLLRRLRYLTCT